MDYIEHTYTIQWVGPMNYEEYKEYINNPDTLDPNLFNLYYFEARQDKRYKWHTYIGIHKQNDGINKRVNPAHEHLGHFIRNNAEIRIWIGNFAKEINQKPKNIDIVETLFIKAYNDKFTENKKKKVFLPKESVCVINTYYSKHKEEIIKRKSDKPFIFDDVLIYLEETNCFMHGNLNELRGAV